MIQLEKRKKTAAFSLSHGVKAMLQKITLSISLI